MTQSNQSQNPRQDPASCNPAKITLRNRLWLRPTSKEEMEKLEEPYPTSCDPFHFCDHAMDPLAGEDPSQMAWSPGPGGKATLTHHTKQGWGGGHNNGPPGPEDPVKIVTSDISWIEILAYSVHIITHLTWQIMAGRPCSRGPLPVALASGKATLMHPHCGDGMRGDRCCTNLPCPCLKDHIEDNNW